MRCWSSHAGSGTIVSEGFLGGGSAAFFQKKPIFARIRHELSCTTLSFDRCRWQIDQSRYLYFENVAKTRPCSKPEPAKPEDGAFTTAGYPVFLAKLVTNMSTKISMRNTWRDIEDWCIRDIK